VKGARRGVVMTVPVAIVAVGVFWHGTDGFASFTAEAVRRAEIVRAPRPIALADRVAQWR
jgi:hypothetical protein